ncbi:MAG: diaminopimelate decarboxylase [Thermoguttaceae bacterium]|nr:diaminopimelate decarboxylase [Thermoguttaceae bacterium]
MAEQFSFQSTLSEIAGVPVGKLATEFGGTPVYVYDGDAIKRRVAELARVGKVRYAQKACSNIAILKLVRSCGAVVDAVSAGEIRRALTAGYKPEEIAYTADIFDEDALELVVGEASGCVVNVGSIDMIHQIGCRLGSAAEGRELTMRVNPGFGHGETKKTNTGGPRAKHGIWYTQIHEAVLAAEHFGMNITGLHMHIGSGGDFEHLAKVGGFMRLVADAVGSRITTISCGGGVPTPYRAGEERIDLAEYARVWREEIDAIERNFGHKIDFEIEPGRYVVAESGYLIAQIRAVKKQGDLAMGNEEENNFYLVDAGFTHLVRPAFYGSYHHASLARNPQNGPTAVEGELDAIVGGPLCESGDVFTQVEGGEVVTRRLPAAEVGDYLVFTHAGAYGAAMASNYNSKFLAPEVLIENGVPRLIRRKQSFEHMIANEIF